MVVGNIGKENEHAEFGFDFLRRIHYIGVPLKDKGDFTVSS
jgi:hypothetical protein